MQGSQFRLLRSSRFLPHFVVLFTGAFIDNLMKAMVSVMLAFGLWDTGGMAPEVLVSLAAALFILPFILFCPFAGALSDCRDKAALIRRNKGVEIGLVLAGIAALYSGSLYFALAVLFGLGVQSAFFAPNKFSILPEILDREALVAGNALVSAGTYVAILLGTIAGSLLAPAEYGKEAASVILLAFTLIGFAGACKVPSVPPDAEAAAAARKPTMNVPLQIWRVMRVALEQGEVVRGAIFGTAWFYFVAVTFHAQFPVYTRKVLGGDETVLSLFMVLFSLGVALGGLMNNRVLRGRARAAFVPWAALALAGFGVDIYFAGQAAGGGHELLNAAAFVSRPVGLRLCFDMFALAAAAGFFVVPLRTIVQEETPLALRARVVAAGSLIEAVFILLSGVGAALLFSVGMRVEELYLVVSLMTLLVGGAMLLPGVLEKRRAVAG